MYFLYAVHDFDPAWARWLPEAGVGGWCVTTHEIGSDANNNSGHDFTDMSNYNVTPIARINFSHHGQGTIPPDRNDWPAFAQRCANFVKNSRGCEWFTIGNEPNLRREWGRTQPVTAGEYGHCYRLCYDAIKAVAPDVMVAPAAIGPWNVDTGRDWIDYFLSVVHIWMDKVDWINIHTYSRGYHPHSVTSEKHMKVPYERYFNGFQTYKDFLDAVPRELQHLPVHITETNGNAPWPDDNTGWIQAAYAEIDRHNSRTDTQKIYSLALFRWPEFDTDWQFETKIGVHEDFKQAMEKKYRVPDIDNAASNDGDDHVIRFPSVHGGGEKKEEPMPPQERDWDPRLTERGVTIGEPELQVREGDLYWRVVQAEWMDTEQSGGRHHIYVDALSNGERVVGLPFLVEWPGGQAIIKTKTKPGEKWSGNFIMSPSRNEFSIVPDDEHPAESVRGIGMGMEEPGGFNAAAHTSTGIKWELVRYSANGQSEEEPAGSVDNSPPEEPQPMPPQLDSGIIDPRTALAFLDVESGNRPFTAGLLTIRFEVHRFEHFLGNQGLFNRHFRYTTRKYNEQYWRYNEDDEWRHAHGAMAARHELLKFARSLDNTAALNSTGMGMAQIMGHNARRVGFRSPQEMFNLFSDKRYGPNAQIMGFVNYVLSDPNLVDALRRRDWHRAVTLYNGEGQQSVYIPLLQKALVKIEELV